jgi:hypothetical protein
MEAAPGISGKEGLLAVSASTDEDLGHKEMFFF